MIKNLIDSLKGPELVVKVQNFFGVKYPTDNTETYQQSANTNGIINEFNKTDKTNRALIDRNGLTNSDDNKTESQNGSLVSDGDIKQMPYQITNRFWYYLFLFGTELGDEIFYVSFIPFFIWNVDTPAGRKVIFLWSIVMYVGQSLKEIICWPRPGPPVQRLQSKWSIEYGMPSTHAMVSIAMPFASVIYTLERYEYSAIIGIGIACCFTLLVSISRIYLGMHSILDVIVGAIITIALLTILIPLISIMDQMIITTNYAFIIMFIVSIIMMVYFPKSDRWTPTQGDTAMTVSVCVGIEVGAWLNSTLGLLASPAGPPPYAIEWPTYASVGLLLLRTISGLVGIFIVREIAKPLSYWTICCFLGRNVNEVKKSKNCLTNRDKNIAEISCKYFTCWMIGISTQFILPIAFNYCGINRWNYYME